MNKVVEHLFVFEGNNVVRDFPGNYSRFTLNIRNAWSLKRKKAAAGISKQAKEKEIKEPSNKLTYKEQKEFDLLEENIAMIEREREEIIAALSGNEAVIKDYAAFNSRLDEIARLLDAKEYRWLELSEKMINLK